MSNNKQILGLSHSEGEYNGREYNNYIFYIGYDLPTDGDIDNGIGYIFTDTVKISQDHYLNLLKTYCFENPDDFLFCIVEDVFYNKYRRAVSFVLKDV